jgi:hypothetical protein
MQADAVGVYHWMSHGQFLIAVALGQLTPGPVTQTLAAVGYSAAGFGGALLAALVAFAPSFSFILLGAARFERLLMDARVLAFLAGAAPAAARAIIGAAVPLTAALDEGRRRSARAAPRRRGDAAPRWARRDRCRAARRPGPALSARQRGDDLHDCFTRSFPSGHKTCRFAGNSLYRGC